MQADLRTTVQAVAQLGRAVGVGAGDGEQGGNNGRVGGHGHQSVAGLRIGARHRAQAGRAVSSCQTQTMAGPGTGPSPAAAVTPSSRTITRSPAGTSGPAVPTHSRASGRPRP